MKPFLLIPDGVGVRNFLLSNTVDKISENHPLCILHIINKDILVTYKDSLRDSIEWYSFIDYHENPFRSMLRYALSYSHMYWAKTTSMRHIMGGKITGSIRRRLLHLIAKSLARIMDKPSRIQKIDKLHCFMVKNGEEIKYYRDIFEKSKPSVLFCSHQRPSIILPAVLAARSLAIPTATFIFSWDNLTSKGRIAAPFDHFLVWSEHMKTELLQYYPDVSKERVHVVGTPQFEPYADPSLLWSRDTFFKKIGVDPSYPLICYSGGDMGTCPEDHEHVRILMQQIRSGQIEGHPQVLLRPSPVDIGTRFDSIREDFPEVIYARPEWVHTVPGDWSRVIPTAEDVQFLANLTFHADLNVNMASTMTLDFAIHDKPVVNIAFDVANPPIFGKPIWDFYYQFEHYQPIVKLGAARFARSPNDLAEYINLYLSNPALDREQRRQLVELEVKTPIGCSNQSIIEVLEQISL